MTTVRQMLAGIPVLPVLTIEHLDDAVPLARTLFEAGLSVIEITLRTPVALTAVERIAGTLPEVTVGAGTVLSAADLASAQNAGAAFAVSPGTTQTLYDVAAGRACPLLLPGVSTASEIVHGLEHGYDCFKFFPAAAAGGAAALKAFSGPFPSVVFCPTGGIDAASASQYLALPNVVTVGGTWMVPPDDVRRRAWQRIHDLAESCRFL